MSYLARFLEASKSDEILGGGAYKTYKTPPDEAASPPPAPLAPLRGPRRTAWGTLAWSDPDAPPLELFGPATGDVIAGPAADPEPEPDVRGLRIPRARGGDR